MVAELAATVAPPTLQLQAALAAAPNLAAAVELTLDYLRTRDLSMSSLYLARGDRLRCLGQRGYAHVQDGLLMSVGVMGRTYKSGKSVRVLAADAPEYVAEVPGIVDEVCVPIWVAEKVVGVLNVECTQVLPPDALPIVEECARLFGDRLASLGGPPGESTADRRIRHSSQLAAITDIDALWAYAVDAACGLAQMSAGVLIDLHQPAGLRVVAAVGGIGERLREVPEHTWTTIAGLVSLGASCHTSGSAEGLAFSGYRELSDAGAHSLIIVPVFADGQCRALLVCADHNPAAPAAVPVERLEMLAAQLGSRLQMLQVLDELGARTMQDPLTGLGNRTWFVAEVAQRLDAWSRRGTGQFAVMFCDLNGFKDVNDSLGHAAGDRLLMIIADRMRARLHPDELLARLGGDEFAFCSDRFPTVADAVERASDIPSLLAPHFDLDGVEVAITASIGIAIVSADDPSPSDAPTLLGEADAAMYEAKRHGRSGVALYTDELRVAAADRLAMATGLRKAVADDQLVLLYQPVVALPSAEIIGMEALLRWQHPQRGLLAPSEFIAIAEDTGVILQLGRWALGSACAQLASWENMLTTTVPSTLGVNLSARQLTDPSLPDIVEAALATSGLAPSRLVLEITESTLMEDVASSHAVLGALKDLGVVIAVDDFGTGFSSLAYLKRFPVDILKIDHSFIDGLPDNPESSVIVAAIIGMAKALGLDIVAEGVETVQQRDCLTRLGCPNAQGYLFQRPKTAQDMTAILAGRALDSVSSPSIS